MALLTKYGTLHGFAPSTGGRVFWVASSANYTVDGRACSGSDNNDGLHPERAVITLARAVALATANVGDVIVLLPGAHSWTASVALNKAGLTILGTPGGGRGNFVRPKVSITTTAADEIINVTAADIEIANIRIIPVTAQRGIDFTTAANRLYIHDCSVDLSTPAASTSTSPISTTTAAQTPQHVLIENVYVENGIASGAQGPAIEMGDAKDYVVRGCYFVLQSGTWAAVVSGAGATSQRGLWQGNTFLAQCASTMTIGLRGTAIAATGAVQASDNYFLGAVASIPKPFDDYGANDLEIINNYQSSGASGSVIITAIT